MLLLLDLNVHWYMSLSDLDSCLESSEEFSVGAESFLGLVYARMDLRYRYGTGRAAAGCAGGGDWALP